MLGNRISIPYSSGPPRSCVAVRKGGFLFRFKSSTDAGRPISRI